MINVQNKFIKIQNGINEVIVHNYIFDRYLEHIHNSQFLDDSFLNHNSGKNISVCYIKLDEPITDIDNIQYTDFDLAIREKNSNTVGNKNGCTITYNFDSEYSITLAKDSGYAKNIDLTEYAGRKITALAFMNFRQPLAFVDTSEFNINIIEDQSIMIVREDECTSNMECVGIDFPYHLLPTGKIYWQQISETGYIGTQIFARLYSVGFGTSKGKMLEEYKLDDNEIQINRADTSFSFSLKTGEKRTLYPSSRTYAGSHKYPIAYYTDREIHPSISNYTSSRKYPLRANVKYIIYKYELTTFDKDNNIIHLNQFYTMNLPSLYIGLCEVKTKTERRN